MKQTAVEWFQDQIIKIVNGTCELSEIQIFEQAKEMEKEQMIGFYKWMLEMNRPEHAERYFHFSDTDMLEFYLKERKIVNNFNL